MPPRIQVIGSLNVDFTTVTPQFPGPGETLTATSLTVNAGGKGANQCVACGRASFTSKSEHDVEVEMIGAVGAGDPYYASLLKPTLEESGVDCSGVREIKHSQTGTATIIVDAGSGGENRILVVPGANHDGMGDAEEVLQRALSKEIVPDVVVMQGEIPKHTVFGVIRQLQGKTAIVFNPAPVYPDGIPRDLLGMIRVLVVNETEILQIMAKSLVNKGVQLPDESGLDEGHLIDFANSLHMTGLEIIIITLGSRGSFFSMGKDSGQIVEPVRVSEVVDTTAAGDTFVGYFSVALARHLFAHGGNLQEFDAGKALLKANQQAAKCVQRAGAMQSIPWGYE
jgi:ribokinase